MTPEALRARCVSRGPGAGIFGERTAQMLLDAADRIEALEAQLVIEKNVALERAAMWCEEKARFWASVAEYERETAARGLVSEIRGMKTR